jgi:hypothetical protein
MTQNHSLEPRKNPRTILATFDAGVPAPVPITALDGNFSLLGNAGFHGRLRLALHEGFPEGWKNPERRGAT